MSSTLTQLSKAEIAAAEGMHRFVETYERQRKMGQASLIAGVSGLSFGVLTLVHRIPNSFPWMVSIFGGVMAFALFAERSRKLRYERYSAVLSVLEREHGEELPWNQERKILDEAAQQVRLATQH